MEFNALLQWLGDVPTWVWIVGVVGLLILTGDRVLWDFEVKFPRVTGIGRGEIEFEGFRKRGATIQARFELDENYRGRALEIRVNGESVYTIPANKTGSARTVVNERYGPGQPAEGDVVEVFADDELLFSGRLALD